VTPGGLLLPDQPSVETGETVDLQHPLEQHLADAGNGQPNIRPLVQALKAAIAAGRFDDAIAVLQRAVVPSLDYTAAQALYRVYTQLKPNWTKPAAKTRIAILSNQTADQLKQAMELFLFSSGISASFYKPDFGVLRQEILDPTSALYEFKPKILFLATTWRDLGHLPAPGDSRDRVDQHLENELADWRQLWQTAHDRLGCQILQNNFDSPPWRQFSNHEARHPSSLGRFITRINDAFAGQAPPYVTIHDIDHLANMAGRWTWGEERFFHHAKMPCAPESLIDYAHSAASLVTAQTGLAKKCLVLDLDNTLWGGVIGDDGLGGIRLGQGSAEGEAYLSFQRYVKALESRGVILAVCSKNEDHIAREVFEKHPEMVLKLDDISCFVANWTDKATNLRTIAKQLNIGLNSLVFVDDNPAERSIVRQLAPDVAVPEIPADPAAYIRAVEHHRFFQLTSVNDEDLRRTGMYRENAAREQAEASAGSVEAFLETLRMKATSAPVTATSLERTAQLISRSNQFNLTTRRYSAAEVQALAADPQWITRTISLADRFGDNGLISVLFAKVQGDVLEIDTWLMSCRVLKRGVEDLALANLVRAARARGLRALRGEFIPTPKNELVRHHYARLGFIELPPAEAGSTRWELAVDGWTGRPYFIEEIETDA
jgi:FkbH-like protein